MEDFLVIDELHIHSLKAQKIFTERLNWRVEQHELS
ncbi:hypothetical protein HNP81_001502 [Peribacillus huizhouensis]|uniref:Uncharacterized protein n=1 Tax=Peribacillus huizhouensis TaxID=1501239 RepID=A0ABR6CPF1_9BACI|nr:hypothetical protein [Peribacillus huizhouensis]